MSDNEHLCGALDPVADQNANRGDVRSKKHDFHNAPLFQAGQPQSYFLFAWGFGR